LRSIDAWTILICSNFESSDWNQNFPWLCSMSELAFHLCWIN
jgi:hypothetical protein